jgi:hypothetical protein
MKRGLLVILVVLCAVFLTAQGCQINQGQYNEDLLPTPDVECASISHEDDFCLDSNERGFCDSDGLYTVIQTCPTGFECLDANHPSECIPLSADVDSDGDGVFDNVDVCPDFDDAADTDADGTPDGCDLCEGHDDLADADGDGVPDGCEGDVGSCIVGVIENAEGTLQDSVGVEIVSDSSTTTNSVGVFCLEGDGTLELDVTYTSPYTYQTPTERLGPFTVPVGDGTCTTSSLCENVGTLTVGEDSLANGYVLGLTGSPEVGITVLSSLGETAVTGADMNYCLPVPVGETVHVYVEPQEGELMYLPRTVITRMSDPDDCSFTVNGGMLSPVTLTTCVTGEVLGSGGAPVSGVSIDVFADGFPEYPVALTTTGADGIFGTYVPAATPNLEVIADSSTAFSIVGVDAYGSGQSIDETNYGECFDLGSVTLP